MYETQGLSVPFKKQSIDDTSRPLSKEEFEELSLEDAFQAVFPGLSETNWKEACSKPDFDFSQMIYIIRLKNLTG